jgi:hypothetical protein
MSVIERIKQIQTPVQQKPGEVELEKARLQKVEAIQYAKEDVERQKKEAQAKFIIQETERIMAESGIINGLQELDQEISKQKHLNFVGRIDDHSLIYEPEKSRALLVWGYGFQVDSCGFEVGSFGIGEPFQSSLAYAHIIADSPREEGTGNYGFAYIEVYIDIDNKTIKINNKTLGRKEWKKRDLSETILAKAFLEPKREYRGPTSNYDCGDDGRSMN